MASPTYTVRALVLRKTKLGEADLVVTLLAEDGSQVRAVAKGARKPTSSFAARLELYSLVDVLCAKGRTLDIVKEVRLVVSNERLRRDMEHAAAAAPMSELLEKVSQAGLENSRLFALTVSAFSHLDACGAAEAPMLTSAHLLKALAFCGLRPSLDTCAVCGESHAFSSLDCAENSAVYFSFSEGGIVCSSCRQQVDAVVVSARIVLWMRYLMLSTFDDIASHPADVSAAFAVLEVVHQWTRFHIGSSLKSLNFLFTCGLY